MTKCKFNIGDIVEVIDASGHHQARLGSRHRVVNIKNVYDDGEKYLIYVEDGFSMYEKRFEKINTPDYLEIIPEQKKLKPGAVLFDGRPKVTVTSNYLDSFALQFAGASSCMSFIFTRESLKEMAEKLLEVAKSLE